MCRWHEKNYHCKYKPENYGWGTKIRITTFGFVTNKQHSCFKIDDVNEAQEVLIISMLMQMTLM